MGVVAVGAAGVTLGQTTTPPTVQTTVYVEADAHVDSGKPRRNFGGAARLKVGEVPELRTYLRFNVPALQGTVRRAWLRIRVDTGSSRGFDVHPVSSTTWTESGITYANAPALGGVAARSGVLSTQTWAVVDVSSLVARGGRISLGLRRSTSPVAVSSRALAKTGVAARQRAAQRRARRRAARRRKVTARAAETEVALYSRETGASAAQLVIETEVPLPPDTTPPTVGLTAPADGATVSGVTSVKADAADASGVAKVEFLADGVVVGTDTSAPYEAPWDTAAVGDGGHSLSARATDAVGNVATSTARSVTVHNAPPPDTTPPTVAITAPPAGATLTGVTRVGADASDASGVAAVQFLAGATVIGTDTTAPYSIDWNTTTVADGPYALRARATDAAGNATTSPGRDVTVDNIAPPDTIPPTVALTAPADGATVGGTTAISADAADNAGIAKVEFLVGGQVVGTDVTAPYSVSWDTTSGFAGPQTLTARATDIAGNVTTSAPRGVTVSNGPAPDVTPPTVGLTAPVAGATVSATTTVTATATDPSGVAKVELLVDGIVAATDTTAPYSFEWNTTSVADGLHSLAVRAVDTPGNVATTPGRDVTVANRPVGDTTPPQTTIGSGPANTYRSGLAEFGFSSDEAGSTFECSLDGAAFAACTPGTLRHVANGAHRFRVRARDAAGNVDATPAEREWFADALLQNGTFETRPAGWVEQGIRIPGWAGYQSSVTILPGGRAGNKARVEAAAGANFYSMYDMPRSVDSSVAGRAYVARGYVRSDTPGKQVCLEVVERSRSAIVGSTHRCVTTTTAWQAFPATTRTAAGNGNNVYVVVSQDAAAAGNSFEVDELSLDDGSALSIARPTDPGGDPVLLGFGDIASCQSSGDESVARLIDTTPGTVAMVGDTEQNNASANEFDGCFDSVWDRHMWRVKPAVGDHEYRQPGATPYWDTFGDRAGTRGKGWYSYDLGAWHIVVLNSNCTEVGGCGPGSEQYEWLEADLAANATSCIGAYFHHPRFSAGTVHGSKTHVQPFWDVLYRFSAEWVLGGNDHTYQRFAPQTPTGALDATRGIRQFVVGTGGAQHYPLGAPLPNSQVQHSGSFGALQLTLGATGYQWRFLAQDGKSFTDTGAHACSPLPAPDTTPPSVQLTAPAGGATLAGTVRLAATATDDDAVETVEFRAGDRLLATDTAAPYTADVDVSALPTGPIVLTAVARDRSGNTTTSSPVNATVASSPVGPNLISNPGFETGLDDWSGFRATLAQVTGGASGAYAARTTYGGSGTSYSIITGPVSSTTAGTAYRANAWIRSTTPGGRRICLRLREMGAGGALGGAETCVTAGQLWQQFGEVRYTAVGGGRVDLYAYQEGPLSGDSFDLDDARLNVG